MSIPASTMGQILYRDKPVPYDYVPPPLLTIYSAHNTPPVSVLRKEFSAGDSLTPHEADCACRDIGEHHLLLILTTLTNLRPEMQIRFAKWLDRDIQSFIENNLDLGLAYATCRTAWRWFNFPRLNIGAWRQQTWNLIQKMDKSRKMATSEDKRGRKVIRNPYMVMPRRMWDLKSNRVIDFKSRVADFQLLKDEFPDGIPQGQNYPYFWAVTHAWTADLYQECTSVNGYQWPVPLPVGITLEEVRSEILQLGGEYVWLDVACLRQEAKSDPAKSQLKAEEWEIDVPTIGNIYIAAARIVRYFNGLGRDFKATEWDDSRHWLRRAWTLQEIGPESITHTGGVGSMHRFLDTVGYIGGTPVTLRNALARIRHLTEAARDPIGFGCRLFDIMYEMRWRFASNPVDKVAGVLYLVRTHSLLAYRADMTCEEAWTWCCHNLNYLRGLELLFDFPSRGGDTQLFPTWTQVLNWPVRKSELPYKHPPMTRSQIPYFTPLAVQNLPEWRVFVREACLLSEVQVESVGSEYRDEYLVKKGSHTVLFLASYRDQAQISDGQYTLAVPALGDGYNWVVCEAQGCISGMYKTWPPTRESQIEALRFKKIGVLTSEHTNRLFNNDLQPITRDCVFF